MNAGYERGRDGQAAMLPTGAKFIILKKNSDGYFAANAARACAMARCDEAVACSGDLWSIFFEEEGLKSSAAVPWGAKASTVLAPEQ